MFKFETFYLLHSNVKLHIHMYLHLRFKCKILACLIFRRQTAQVLTFKFQQFATLDI